MTEPPAPPATPSQERRQTRRESLGLVVVAVTIALLAAAFIWPWVPPRMPAYADRHRFAPVAHGDGRLYIRHSAGGEPQAWISENVSSIPVMLVLGGDVPAEIRDSLLAVMPDLYDRGRYPPGVQLFRMRARTFAPGAAVEEMDSYVLRHVTGDYTLGLVNLISQTVISYIPPLPQLPADLAPDSSLTQTGTVIARFPYTADLTIRATTRLDGIDCRAVQTRQSITIPGSGPVSDDVVVTYCDGLGAVEAVSYIDSRPDQRITAVYSATLRTELALPPTPLAAVTPPMPAANWAITSFAQAEAWFPGPATTSLLYLAAPDPVVLVATRGGVLSALSAQQPQTIRWSWQAGGDIYSTPTLDPSAGRIYFGNVDRRLTALSVDGFFLWSQRVGDNIGASPLRVDDLVIVPSEDAQLYAFDAATGAPRWQVPLDGSSVASPVSLTTTLGQFVLSATDTGVVTAHHIEDGAAAWTAEVDAAVAAGLVAANDLVVVSTLKGAVTALDPATGETRWTTKRGWPIRFTPALGRDTIYLHDENGSLVALDLASGRVRWQNGSVWHVGSPLLLHDPANSNAEAILSTVTDGRVILYTADGTQIGQWINPATAGDATTSFTFGAAAGGDAYWMADSNGMLWRLGPPDQASTDRQP